MAGAYGGILIRCIYRYGASPPQRLLEPSTLIVLDRIAEMAGGWGNPIMQDEVPFVILEGL